MRNVQSPHSLVVSTSVAHWGSSSPVRGMGKKHENILQNQLCAGNNTGQCMSCSVQFRGPVPSLSFATTSSPTVKRNSNGVVVAAVQSHKQHAARNVWAKSIKAPEPGWNLEQLEDMSYWVPSTKSTAAATNCNEYVGLRQGFSRSFLVHCLMINDYLYWFVSLWSPITCQSEVGYFTHHVLEIGNMSIVRAFECFKECLWAGNNTGQCMSCSVQFRGPVPSLSFATTSSPTVKRNSNGVVVAAVQSHKQHAARNVWAKSIKAPEPGWNLEQLEDMSYWVPSTKSTAAATNCNEYVGLRQGFSRSFLVHCLMINDYLYWFVSLWSPITCQSEVGYFTHHVLEIGNMSSQGIWMLQGVLVGW